MKKHIFFLYFIFFFSLLNAEGGDSGATEKKEAEAPHKVLDSPIDRAYLEHRYANKKGEGKSRIAVVIYGVGMDSTLTQRILDVSPRKFCIGLSPYIALSAQQIKQIKQQGHEVLVVQPFEGFKSTDSHQDPLRLRRDLPDTEKQKMIEKVLESQSLKIIGMMNDQVSPLLRAQETYCQLAKNLNPKGLFFVNLENPIDHIARRLAQKAQLSMMSMDYTIVEPQSIEKLRFVFMKVEELSKETGYASIAVFVSQTNFDELMSWITSLNLDDFELTSIVEMKKHV
jgi:polysaccharide deacetylase 2 family uncharacterized protein YibQ